MRHFASVVYRLVGDIFSFITPLQTSLTDNHNTSLPRHNGKAGVTWQSKNVKATHVIANVAKAKCGNLIRFAVLYHVITRSVVKLDAVISSAFYYVVAFSIRHYERGLPSVVISAKGG